MHWCEYNERYVEMDDCHNCYESDECDYGYAKDPGEDGYCQFFGSLDPNGNTTCRQGFERHCEHKVYATISGMTRTLCGLYSEINTEPYEEDDEDDEDNED